MNSAFFLQMQHLCQVMLSLYGSRLSYTAITNLQGYEETSKKLAEWSKEAERQLHMTRTTQTTGALAIFASLLTSTTLALVAKRLPHYVSLGASPAMLVIVILARRYIKGFWTPAETKDGKPVGNKIPLPKMGDYNEAVKMTEALLQVLEYLEYSWVGTSFVAGMLGYG